MVNKVSVFWTGFPYDEADIVPYKLAKGWAAERFPDCNFVLYDRALANEDFKSLNSADFRNPPSPEENTLRIQHMSKAFARRSTGVVYVVMPDGENPNPTSTWVVWEFPTLTRNQRVEKIIRVNWPSKREVPIWWKGNPPQGETAPPGKV